MALLGNGHEVLELPELHVLIDLRSC
jgi:hypothetical protein